MNGSFITMPHGDTDLPTKVSGPVHDTVHAAALGANQWWRLVVWTTAVAWFGQFHRDLGWRFGLGDDARIATAYGMLGPQASSRIWSSKNERKKNSGNCSPCEREDAAGSGLAPGHGVSYMRVVGWYHYSYR